jgi:hypothetical protein
MSVEPSALAFAVHEHEPRGLEIRVNFGMFAGRKATAAEIDELAAELLGKVASVSIVAEDRHEVGSHSEASVHQVRIEIAPESLPPERRSRQELAGRVIETAERWAHACIDERHVDVT